ncbi:MAG TPA: tyrosine-type recombinase/integrase [Candidatus Angelobacter sp.]|nr:tyrosine-type recombinase/integrase [Candidatus Angelobacter sp.]
MAEQHRLTHEQRVRQLSRKSSRKAAERVVYRTLADGTKRTYRYPAYKRRPVQETVGDVLAAWQRSPEWNALASVTQRHYSTYIRPLLGMESVAAHKIERRQIVDIRNALVEARGPGAATAFVRAASALFGWAVENGWLKTTPTLRMKRLSGGHLPTWTQQDLDLALAHLPEHLRRPVVLAAYSGQRRGDLVRLPWSAYDGKSLRLKQQKTGAALVVPCHPLLVGELDRWRAEAKSTMILANKFGRPWRPNNLTKQLQMALADIPGFQRGANIHGLRKLAAVRLAEAGCTLHEIGAITGHKSLAMIQLYTAATDQERLANAAVLRWTGKPK